MAAIFNAYALAPIFGLIRERPRPDRPLLTIMLASEY